MIYNLKNKELEVMNILWKNDKPLTALEISRISNMTINTVRPMLKNLLEYELVEVADIVYSGTTLSRNYKTKINKRNFEIQKFVMELKKLKREDITASNLIVSFLKQENKKNAMEELEELERTIKEQRKLILQAEKEDTGNK